MKIIRLTEEHRAVALQGSSELEVDVSLLEDPVPGQYIIVHAGYALETVDADDAEERIEMLDGASE